MISTLVHLAVEWVLLTIAFLAAAAVVPGFDIKNPKSGFWVAATFAVMNVVIAPILTAVFGAVTLGLACLLPGVLRFVITVIVIKIVDAVSDHLKVKGLFPAVLAAVVLSVVAALLDYGLATLTAAG
ncbi:MAG: phage holin family protein [Sandaracinaceae bacterium]|nr:phage holin family protein [Sandaracinaceae bacterium]